MYLLVRGTYYVLVPSYVNNQEEFIIYILFVMYEEVEAQQI